MRSTASSVSSGADDYVTKPFSPARVAGPGAGRAAALRARRGATRSPARALPIRRLAARSAWPHLSAPDGTPVALTKGEYALLIAFLDAPQRPLTREYLLQ